VMSRAMELLEECRRVEAEARAEIGRLLAPASLVVTALAPEPGGWTLRLAPLAEDGAAGRAAAPVTRPLAGQGAAVSEIAPRVRAPGETLVDVVGGVVNRLHVNDGVGRGGLRTPVLPTERRIAALAGTLVGDTVLALRHLGDPEEGEAVVVELHRQLRRFEAESTRLQGHGDPEPFLSAVDRWMPAGFPRGSDFLSFGAEVGDA
jgi:hypothetical protein